MKKRSSETQNLLTRKREKHRLKRLRTGPSGRKSYLKEFYLKVDERIIEKQRNNFSNDFEFYAFLSNNEFIKATTKLKIKIPKEFDFREHYIKSIKVLKEIISTIYNSFGEEIVIDFRKCKRASQLPLFFLKLCIDNISEDLIRINNRLRIKKVPKVTILISKERDVNLRLFLCELIERVNLDDEGFKPAFTTGFIVGSSSKKGVRYNDKGENCNRVVRFIDACTKRYGFELSSEGKRQIDGMISEILNNAEDHSPLNSYYINANFSANYDINDDFDPDDLVGEVNVTIMNFGDSIYNGLEKTKGENKNMYEQVKKYAQKIRKIDSTQTIDNLFTLFALQDGVSRLKYIDQSRGTGTMKFITSFFHLGGYEDEIQNYIPRLSILSGETAVYVNNENKPSKSETGFYFMPLNEENDLTSPPNKQNLVTLEEKFPGTLLSARVYLSRQHMLNSIEKVDG